MTVPERCFVLEDVPEIENLEYPDIFCDALSVALCYRADEVYATCGLLKEYRLERGHRESLARGLRSSRRYGGGRGILERSVWGGLDPGRAPACDAGLYHHPGARHIGGAGGLHTGGGDPPALGCPSWPRTATPALLLSPLAGWVSGRLGRAP